MYALHIYTYSTSNTVRSTVPPPNDTAPEDPTDCFLKKAKARFLVEMKKRVIIQNVFYTLFKQRAFFFFHSEMVIVLDFESSTLSSILGERRIQFVFIRC
jgi:hypothetical protein